MTANFRWIAPMYDFDAATTHVGVPENARSSLITMAGELAGTNGLVAVYVPEGTADVYDVGDKKGRVMGGVRLLNLPRGRKVEDYYYDDWDGSRRWPIGWPCEVVYAPDVTACPFLRDHIEHLFGPGSFGPYVTRFQQGPFPLVPRVRDRLNNDFGDFVPLA